MEQVVLLLGGNIGDVESCLERAIELIDAVDGVSNVRCSKRYKTEAWGFGDGCDVAPFVNQAVVFDACEGLEPLVLLDATQMIERELGREREFEMQQKIASGERYLSRTMDIDTIFWGDRVIESERLIVPHPLMQERDFVLRPMVDIVGDMLHPTLKVSCKELLERL
ncbi:MAG: 2-amino-4-hydroxy-6-hydroxymethyldihydropteridine diphosphokinase [Rikenellaceae bacterium]